MISEVTPQAPQNLTTAHTRTTGISKSYFYRTHILWNQLPYEIRSIKRPSIFKSRLIDHLWSNITTQICELNVADAEIE